MPRSEKDEIGLAELHTQLRIMTRLMGAQLKATMGQQELVRLLSTTGASNAEIADVLDTTSATVATTLQRLRKKTTRASSRGAGAEDAREDSNP